MRRFGHDDCRDGHCSCDDMGLSRFPGGATGRLLGWDDVNYLSGNSDGSWFMTQFIYSSEIFQNLTDCGEQCNEFDSLFGQWAALYMKNVPTSSNFNLCDTDACKKCHVPLVSWDPLPSKKNVADRMSKLFKKIFGGNAEARLTNLV